MFNELFKMYHFRYLKNLSILISIFLVFMTLVIFSYHKLSHISDVNTMMIPKMGNPDVQKLKDRETLWEGIAKDREKSYNILQDELLKVINEFQFPLLFFA